MQPANRALHSGFLRSAYRYPERPALQLAAETLTYKQMRSLASRLANTLSRHASPTEPALTGVFGHRSIIAYAGVLAGLFRGHGYVPFNPGFPVDRTRGMLVHSGCRSIVVDTHGAQQLDEILCGVEAGLLLLIPEQEDVSALSARWPQHTFLTARDLLSSDEIPVTTADPQGIAYLLYTSGSTGRPKGVMVAHRNVTHFVDAMVEHYGVTEQDRFSQTFDLTFDLSAFDMFVAWERGASLCCPTQAQKMLPGKYITDCAISIWFSVPSTAILMNRIRMLKPGRYPGLRYSLFCGEALPVEIMQAWGEAAPNSILENLYGPTELTIACTLYRWDPAQSPGECELGLVPIGDAYPGMHVLVADELQQEVAPGETGELLMSGPQLTPGYYRDPERTAAAFVVPPGRSELHYRTGDRVRRPLPGQPLVYLGRMDNQIKIQGYRVELGEIEATLRQAAGVETAVAIGWPLNASGAEGIVGFLCTDSSDVEAVRQRVIDRLPPYMHPSEIRLVTEWPLNVNGKIDRKALQSMLAVANSGEQ